MVERQSEIGGNCGQLFVGSPRTWSVSSYTSSDGEAFRTLREESDQHPYAVHATYLINLATPKDDLWERSLECLQAELGAAETLGVEYVVFHPGAHTGSGREAGMERVSAGLDRLDIPSGVRLLLENTAGAGTTLGVSFDELARMMNETERSDEELGVCVDTCHAHAAGYELRTGAGMKETIAEIEDAIGLGTVHLLHCNDSKDELGARSDNHQHIGEGEIGEEGFRRVVNEPAFAELPMVIETPKDDEESDPTNIALLRRLQEE